MKLQRILKGRQGRESSERLLTPIFALKRVRGVPSKLEKGHGDVDNETEEDFLT